MTLPPDVIDAFNKLAALQRGKPEEAMGDIQSYHSGVMSFVVEHVGDISNRMAKKLHVERPNMGHHYVDDKVTKTLKTLKHRYGFWREHKENINSNAAYDNVPADEYQYKLNKLLEKYAQEHAKLPVYNKAQYAAREAAVALGNQDPQKAIIYLEYLEKLVRNKNMYNKIALSYERTPDGALKVL